MSCVADILVTDEVTNLVAEIVEDQCQQIEVLIADPFYSTGDSSSGGINYIQDFEPVGARESQTWWNPLTQQLKVYHANTFNPVSPDGGYF